MKNIKEILNRNEAVAFIDGSNNPKTHEYGYGGFIIYNDDFHVVYGKNNDPEMAKMRNVAGEIDGAMAIVKKAEELGCPKMTIFYDYEGIEAWATGAWQAKKEGTQSYVHFMNSKDRVVEIEFSHVYGHTGVVGNEIADMIAKQAVGVEIPKKQKELLDLQIQCYYMGNQILNDFRRD